MSAVDSPDKPGTADANENAAPSVRRYVILAVLVVLAVMIFLIIRRANDEMGHFRRHALVEARLADGTTLTLNVTYGRSHSLRMPRRPWPEWFAGNFPRTLERSTYDESLVLWFTRWDPSTGKPVDFDWWLKCSVEDATGWEIEDREGGIEHFAVRFGDSSSSHAQGPRPFRRDRSGNDCIVASSVLRMFRCAGDSFRLKVYDTNRQVVTEFQVPWPGPPTFPVWQPEPLPVSKTAGDLIVTLKSVSARDGGLVNERDWELGIEPEIEITRSGRRAPWKVDAYWFTDALGNTALNWNCDLSPREAAWKLHARLFRAPDAPPDPAEAWHIGQITLPARGGLQMLNRTRTVNGVRVELLGIGGRGPVVTPWTGRPEDVGMSSGRGGSFPTRAGRYDHVTYHIQTERKGAGYERTVESEAPHLLLKVPPLSPLQKLQLYIVDADGNVLPGGVQRLHEPADDVYWFFAVRGGTQSVNVSIAITDGREVEFLIQPPATPR